MTEFSQEPGKLGGKTGARRGGSWGERDFHHHSMQISTSQGRGGEEEIDERSLHLNSNAKCLGRSIVKEWGNRTSGVLEHDNGKGAQ